MNEKSKHQIKREHFENLIAIAQADGQFSPEEIDFFSERAAAYGISQQEVDHVIKHANELRFRIPMNQEEREEQLSDAVFISMIDGHLDEREYDLCLQIASLLGFRQKDLDHTIELVKKLWALQ